MDDRIEAFINFFINDKLKNLTDEDFKTAIKTLIKERSEVDVTLHDEFWRNWNEIENHDYLFDRREKEIKLLEYIDKAAMIELMTNLLSKEGKDKKKMSVQVVGSVTDDVSILDDKPDEAIYELRYHSCNEEPFVANIHDYKSTLQLYPVHKIIN